MLGEHVTLEQGTGLVHTAPGHGQEDYDIGVQYGLDIYNPVRADGRYDDTVEPPELRGVKVFDANPRIVQLLVDRGVLLNRPTDTVEHSYLHAGAATTPIIFRATPQWFIAMDRPLDTTGGLDATLRGKALSEIDHTVTWVPEWVARASGGWWRTVPTGASVASAPGACPSRCSSAKVRRVGGQLRAHGAGGGRGGEGGDRGLVFGTARALRTARTEVRVSGGTALRKETDIVDVWFDSACAFAAVSERWPDMGLPGDLYLEGSTSTAAGSSRACW